MERWLLWAGRRSQGRVEPTLMALLACACFAGAWQRSSAALAVAGVLAASWAWHTVERGHYYRLLLRERADRS